MMWLIEGISMAQVGPLTLLDIQHEIHTLFSNGIDYPATDEEDYQLRTSLINGYIRVWQNAAGINWAALYDVKADQVIVATGNQQWPTSSTFKRLGGKVKLLLGTQTFKVPVYSQDRLDDDELDGVATYAYISGRPGAYFLNLVGVPQSWVGATIRYRYYRFATSLSATTDIPDLADPNYLIFSVVARLYQLAHNNTGYTVFSTDAGDAWDAMVADNENREVSERERSIPARIKGIGIPGL